MRAETEGEEPHAAAESVLLKEMTNLLTQTHCAKYDHAISAADRVKIDDAAGANQIQPTSSAIADTRPAGNLS